MQTMQQEQLQHAQWVRRKGGHSATHYCAGKLLWHRVTHYLLNFVLLENGKSFTRFSGTLNTEKKLQRGKTCTRDTKGKQETEKLSKIHKMWKHNSRQKFSWNIIVKHSQERRECLNPWIKWPATMSPRNTTVSPITASLIIESSWVWEKGFIPAFPIFLEGRRLIQLES